eukprot:CAMPEP_0196779758 /NCGR_PEP_ID=MMETSP1104-20130614/6568_1 /TAXON_ID=33652 /ORGANISM="Cafeteria sp., Strain Caron Lab Isolate" /LENGTH=265 /DNA_ID=CAMNT_0042149941 /DNA_START=61 /DNA_END=855 /DNA_ORIENTATION=-
MSHHSPHHPRSGPPVARSRQRFLTPSQEGGAEGRDARRAIPFSESRVDAARAMGVTFGARPVSAAASAAASAVAAASTSSTTAVSAPAASASGPSMPQLRGAQEQLAQLRALQARLGAIRAAAASGGDEVDFGALERELDSLQGEVAGVDSTLDEQLDGLRRLQEMVEEGGDSKADGREGGDEEGEARGGPEARGVDAEAAARRALEQQMAELQQLQSNLDRLNAVRSQRQRELSDLMATRDALQRQYDSLREEEGGEDDEEEEE